MTPLDALLTTQNDLISLVTEDEKKKISMNMWVIHVSQSDIKRGVTLPKLLKSTRLRLDSHAFGFYEGMCQVKIVLGSEYTAILIFEISFEITTYVAIKDSEGHFTIEDVYKMNPNSDSVLTVEYGSWKRQTGISVSERIIWKRRSNFNGYNIRYRNVNCKRLSFAMRVIHQYRFNHLP